MKKIISALLICMLAAVCLFTGCSKAKGLKVKDSSGNDRVLVTDENGKPVYDEAGNIVIVDTDEKGNAKKDETASRQQTPSRSIIFSSPARTPIADISHSPSPPATICRQSAPR